MKTKKYILLMIAVIAVGTLSFTFSNSSSSSSKQATTELESGISTTPIGGIAIEEGI